MRSGRKEKGERDKVRGYSAFCTLSIKPASRGRRNETGNSPDSKRIGRARGNELAECEDGLFSPYSCQLVTTGRENSSLVLKSSQRKERDGKLINVMEFWLRYYHFYNSKQTIQRRGNISEHATNKQRPLIAQVVLDEMGSLTQRDGAHFYSFLLTIRVRPLM